MSEHCDGYFVANTRSIPGGDGAAAEALIACDKLGIPNASASAIANYSIYRNAGKSVGLVA